MICEACYGFGTWEFWGRYEVCPVCAGSGEDPDAEEDEEDEEE